MSLDINLSEYIDSFFRFLFGQDYESPISVIILSIIIGFFFLLYHFVIRRKNPEEWRNIIFIEKTCISFLFGIMLLTIGALLKIILDNFGFKSTFSAVLTILVYTIYYIGITFTYFRIRRGNPLNDFGKILIMLIKHLLIFAFIVILFVNSRILAYSFILIGLINFIKRNWKEIFSKEWIKVMIEVKNSFKSFLDKLRKRCSKYKKKIF